MKKTIIISSLLLIASTSIISCKKTSASASLVGTWKSTGEKATSVDSTTTPVTVTTIDTTFTAPPYLLVITFNADGTFSAINNGSSTPELGTYFYGQGKLFIEDNGSSTPTIIGYTLSGNTFTLIQTENNPGICSQTVNIIFTKE
jgi:hypothetical protein